MKLELMLEGYWLASGERIGRMTLVEGKTRAEAMKFWCEQSGLLSPERRKKIHLVEDKEQARG